MIPASRVAERTITRAVQLKGRGLHTGEEALLVLEPAGEGSGLRFFGPGAADDKSASGVPHSRKNAAGAGTAADTAAAHFLETGITERRSRIGGGARSIETVEHLSAAIAGLGISNLVIRLDGPEIPAMDGSAAPFVDALVGAGIREQAAPREVYRVREPIFCAHNARGGAPTRSRTAPPNAAGASGRGANTAIAVFPGEGLRVTYTLDYEHPRLSAQTVSFELSESVFRRELAPARTFCTEAEAEALRARGFGKGADPANTLVMGESGPVGNTLRFPDECARHKVLDLIGDLGLLGFAVSGHVVAVRSGHALNRALARCIREQKGVRR